ncbi:MAG: DUF1800 domain-containing protein [Fimbriimonadaceae bacterium]|jgi:uncharacterized protein (DUF1800 family)|nr:DUF1800 domain-containing protein [Fimbriimonadaceae bacterium]
MFLRLRKYKSNSTTNRWLSTGTLAALTVLPLASNAQAPVRFAVKALDPGLSERWPEPGYFLIKRNRSTTEQTVTLNFSGTAQPKVDFNSSHDRTATFAIGQSEVLIKITPLVDSFNESQETITLYVPQARSQVTITLNDRSSAPDQTETTRFLTQSAFGADLLTLQEVQNRGFEGWMNNQFTRPKGYLQPLIINLRNSGQPIYHTATKMVLWDQVMRPNTSQPDPLRQRVAYSLLQIFVISQQVDALSLNSEGVAHYYDRLLDGAFGNFKDLIRDVTLHPCMGVYLSHRGNRKGDPSINRFPDENFARELMQLFTIGLYQLNQDGSRVLDGNGNPIPTYTNSDITEYARIFTGYQFGGPQNNSFYWAGENYIHPMKLWDREHDLNPKRLLDGSWTPQRTFNPNATDTGAAAHADLELALDSLFNHPNVGPFIGHLLIQRLVTSNPSPAYISRVAGAFNNNGQGVRGDMKAVIKAILLDEEARSYFATTSATSGKKREPYLTLFNLAKAFDARPPSGNWESATYLYNWMLQEPFDSPSVFNFYLPAYRPPGPMIQQGLTGPEFQIMTAVTTSGLANLNYKFIHNYLATWGADPQNQIKLDVSTFLPLAVDEDILVHRLADRLLDRRLSPSSSRIIRQAVGQIPTTGATWQRDRINMALYLLTSTPDFQIQK